MSTLERIEIETAPNPTASVIWLHGLGADGHDFASVVPYLKLDSLEPIRFVFPHAPQIPVTINGGYVMRAWYDILGDDLVRREDEAGLRRSMSLVRDLVEFEKERGTAANRIVLAGFSQGCAMALLTALRQPERLAGVMGLSGYLPLAASTASERDAANQDIPIFLAHGTADPVVPIERARASRDLLQQLGYSIEWHEYPMPHSVCPEELDDISAFLRRVLARP